MARRPYVDPQPPVRPSPVTPPKPRAEFLRRTVDLIDRAEVSKGGSREPLDRFIQDWNHHAHAPMLVELGQALGDLVACAFANDEAEKSEREERDAKVAKVDKILDTLRGIDDLDDLDVPLLDAAWELVGDLAKHWDEQLDTDGIKFLRKEYLDDEMSADEMSAELAALKGQLEDAKKERDEAEAKVREFQAQLDEASKVRLEQAASLHAVGDAARKAQAVLNEASATLAPLAAFGRSP